MTASTTDAFNHNLDRYVAEWAEFLRFPSVSTEPEHDTDCRACAQWLVAHLDRMGFRAELLETSRKPVVFAERAGRPGKPVVLFYGHYDVQPADPLDQWTTPPFEPTLRNHRLYARGAEDNKGQLLYVLKAMESLIAAQALDATVKVLLEGEEESGSLGLSQSIGGWKDRLKADVLLVSDVNMAASGAPAIVMGLRGIVHLTAVLHGPDHDLHSGLHGGLAPNPAMGMARLLSTLHDADGRLRVEGYVDGVKPPTARERELARAVAFDEASYVRHTGTRPLGGEKGLSPAERVGFRPTIEVNGLHSGYGGAGSKTIIPATARVKLTGRLVPRQDPDACLRAIVRHLEANVPAGLRLEIEESHIGGPGLRLDPESAVAVRAREILDDLIGKPTVFLWEGGSIPVVTALAAVSGAQPLMVGFGREDDRCHAPNESFSLEQFRWGYDFYVRYLASL